MLNGDPGNPQGQERISYGLAVVAGGDVAGCVVADGVVAGWAVAGGWLVEGAGDGTAGETAAGVAD